VVAILAVVDTWSVDSTAWVSAQGFGTHAVRCMCSPRMTVHMTTVF